jgi:hypothetical protein
MLGCPIVKLAFTVRVLRMLRTVPFIGSVCREGKYYVANWDVRGTVVSFD